jgi:hypothetical protein
MVYMVDKRAIGNAAPNKKEAQLFEDLWHERRIKGM